MPARWPGSPLSRHNCFIFSSPSHFQLDVMTIPTSGTAAIILDRLATASGSKSGPKRSSVGRRRVKQCRCQASVLRTPSKSKNSILISKKVKWSILNILSKNLPKLFDIQHVVTNSFNQGTPGLMEVAVEPPFHRVSIAKETFLNLIKGPPFSVDILNEPRVFFRPGTQPPLGVQLAKGRR